MPETRDRGKAEYAACMSRSDIHFAPTKGVVTHPSKAAEHLLPWTGSHVVSRYDAGESGGSRERWT